MPVASVAASISRERPSVRPSEGARCGMQVAAAHAVAPSPRTTTVREKRSSELHGMQMLPQPGRTHQRVCGSCSARSADRKASYLARCAGSTIAATSSLDTRAWQSLAPGQDMSRTLR